MLKMLKNAHKLKREMGTVQKGLSAIEVQGTAGGDMVRVTMDGQMKVLSLRIAPSLLEPGKAELVERLVCEAVNNAREKAQQRAAAEMMKLTGGRFPA